MQCIIKIPIDKARLGGNVTMLQVRHLHVLDG